jgi:hypothetical protein
MPDSLRATVGRPISCTLHTWAYETVPRGGGCDNIFSHRRLLEKNPTEVDAELLSSEAKTGAASSVRVKFLIQYAEETADGHVVSYCSCDDLWTWAPALKEVFGSRLKVLHIIEGSLFATVIEAAVARWIEMEGERALAREIDFESMVISLWHDLSDKREYWERVFAYERLDPIIAGPSDDPRPTTAHATRVTSSEKRQGELRNRLSSLLSRYLMAGAEAVWRPEAASRRH